MRGENGFEEKRAEGASEGFYSTRPTLAALTVPEQSPRFMLTFTPWADPPHVTFLSTSGLSTTRQCLQVPDWLRFHAIPVAQAFG